VQRYLLIAAGAALGANARYLVGVWAGSRLGATFPYGTFIVNVTGSLILGFLFTILTERIANATELRWLLAVGFLGSYTTFSSFAVESTSLLQTGGLWSGLLNLASNNLVGLLCAWAGMSIGRMIA